MLFFFFFKQKTAYELRISDWSSDVCSSDLQPPFRLTSLRAKAHALQEAGIDDLFVLHFDRAFSLKTAEAFVVEILVGDLAARHVVVGWDFCFGHKRAGNAGLLKSMGAQHGFGVTAVEPVMTGEGEVYSSSIIRAHLREEIGRAHV